MHERKDIQGMHILDGKWEKILGQDPGSRGIYIETFTKKKKAGASEVFILHQSHLGRFMYGF